MKIARTTLFFLICALIPLIAAGLTPREVQMKAPDGTLLGASYFTPGKPGPGVILLHQCNRQRRVWDPLALSLVAKGLHVLTLDYRGYGESGGRPYMQLTPQEGQVIRNDLWPGDVDVAVAFLQAQEGVDKTRIGAGGASCGVDQSLQLARRNPAIKSLVLLSGDTQQEGWEHLRKTPGLPVLMAAADDDGGIVQAMQWMLGFSRNPRNKFLRYTEGGHGADMFAYQPDLVPAIAEWFHETLTSAPATLSTDDSLPPGPVEEFWTLLNQPGGTGRAMKVYEEAKKSPSGPFAIPEGAVNLLGYQRLQEEKIEDAIEIFKINVAAYPESANVYDSISDAYLAAGQNDLAREYAQKAIDAIERDTVNPEAFKNQIRQSAMQKLKAGTPDTSQAAAQPSQDEIVRMPLVVSVPGMENAKVHRDVVYKSVEGTELKMDVYVPADAKPGVKYPAVLFISGAGNDAPSPKEWGIYRTYGQLMAASGIAGVQFNKRYARAPESLPLAESDMRDLVAYLRDHAESLNVDPDRICVAAYSAGGRLLGPFLREPVAGLRCLASMYAIMGGGPDGRSDFSAVAQLGAVKQKFPIFIGRAGLDAPGLNAGIDLFARDAIAQGFEVTLMNHAQGRHGFDILDDNDRSREIIRALVSFLAQNLKAE